MKSNTSYSLSKKFKVEPITVKKITEHKTKELVGSDVISVAQPPPPDMYRTREARKDAISGVHNSHGALKSLTYVKLNEAQ